ncbi:MAG: type II 3-dehydroquinate dehydratase [Desulfonatronovibrio sp.]
MNNSKYEILVVNGPNLKFIGHRDTDVYGNRQIADIPGILEKSHENLLSRTRLEFFQANGQGEIIDKLEKAWQESVSGIVINPGAYTHTSLALADCLAWIGIPFVEVHLSNVWSRDAMRRQSLTARHSTGVVAGFGIMSYVYGLQALVDFLEKKQ